MIDKTAIVLKRKKIAETFSRERMKLKVLWYNLEENRVKQGRQWKMRAYFSILSSIILTDVHLVGFVNFKEIIRFFLFLWRSILIANFRYNYLLPSLLYRQLTRDYPENLNFNLSSLLFISEMRMFDRGEINSYI